MPAGVGVLALGFRRKAIALRGFGLFQPVDEPLGVVPAHGDHGIAVRWREAWVLPGQVGPPNGLLAFELADPAAPLFLCIGTVASGDDEPPELRHCDRVLPQVEGVSNHHVARWLRRVPRADG